VGRLLAGDLPGALAMNPLAVLVMLAVLVWGLADGLLLARRRALEIELGQGLVPFARAAALALLGGNWLYLVASGR
jgi:hypothetical protein